MAAGPCPDDTRAPDPAPAELLICVTCRRAADDPAGPRAGRALYDATQALEAPDGLRITPVECLQNCTRACTVALRGGTDKWTYVFADLDPDTQPAMLLDGAARYHAAPDGIIPWRDRPEHFKRHCVARIPPLIPPTGDPA